MTITNKTELINTLRYAYSLAERANPSTWQANADEVKGQLADSIRFLEAPMPGVTVEERFLELKPPELTIAQLRALFKTDPPQIDSTLLSHAIATICALQDKLEMVAKKEPTSICTNDVCGKPIYFGIPKNSPAPVGLYTEKWRHEDTDRTECEVQYAAPSTIFRKPQQ